MEWLYAWLPLLGCGAMMFVCMKMMGGMGKTSEKATSNAHNGDDADALRARITELERRLEVESTPATPHPSPARLPDRPGPTS